MADANLKIITELKLVREEIKKANRQMAIRYHPDKVASMGEEY